MPQLLPSNSSCFALKLPSVDADAARNMEESEIKRSTLDARTGAAIVLARSAIFVHGGLVVPLNLDTIDTSSIQRELILHFATEREDSLHFENLRQWISMETFYLDLISRKWECIPTTQHKHEEENESNVLRERLFHSLCYLNGDLYLFGGLTTSLESDYELNATNELWKLSLSTKQWSCVSADPTISRRFNHQMHVLHQYDDDKDTKIVIVGGLDNFDKPLDTIDIYNLETNEWESYNSTPETDSPAFMVNIDGVPTPLIKENSFSLLVEDNEANIPTIAFYSSNSSLHDNKEKGIQSSRVEYSRGPLYALPLSNNSKGTSMSTYEGSSGNKRKLKSAHNLKWPMGEKFGYNILVAGFYPDCLSSNLHVFLYNITSKKWTKLNINCNDIYMFQHRFWKLFLWESHHKAILLGTNSDEGFLPSVQKFDHLLSIGLHMSNLFHSAQGDNKNRQEIFKRSQSSAIQSEIEQFEKYSKYVAPPSEITSIRSIFPSHSMVLGKDSLELYNKLIADFEFITEDGDRLSVPTFLLRKRWGRFFDKLLANAYVQVKSETNLSEVQPRTTTQYSTETSDEAPLPRCSDSTASLEKDYAKPTSQVSLDVFFDKNIQNSPSSRPEISHRERKTASLFVDSMSGQAGKHSSSITKETVESTDDGSLQDKYSDDNENSVSRRDSTTTGVTSSSGGMIFRVPFRSSAENSKHSTPPATFSDSAESSSSSKHINPAMRKLRSGSFTSPSNEEIKKSFICQSRKPSHPTDNDVLLHSHFGFTSPTTSRKASIASAGSSISHVSSNSDRAGEPIYKINNSDDELYLNVALPPQLPMPRDALPAIPTQSPNDHNFSKRFSELLTIESGRFRGISSPLTSRRSSLHQEISLPISQESISGNKIDDIFQDSSSFNDLNKKVSSTSQVQHDRNSLISNPESLTSQNGSFTEVDFEPLLIPRVFYMPWPTETVKAFTEFFYTGQVDGKWPLSPVAIGLFHMAKLYEVPLLLDLILEVFYSIIGKKEDSLLLIARSLKEAFLSRVYALFDDEDTTAIEEYLANSKNYQQYLLIENSLNCIDDGYFDMENLRKASAAFSVDTNSSTATTEHGEKLPYTDLPITPSLVPTIFADSPRGSINSNSSFSYSTVSNILTGGKKSSITQLQQKLNRNSRHQSSLSKEISKSENDIPTSPTEPPLIATSPGQRNTIDDELDRVEEILENPLKQSDSSDSDTSSDLDDVDAGLGFLSKSKIEKSFKERALDLEESIDPLSRVISESVSPSAQKTHFSTKHKGHDQRLLDGERLATLDSLASSNSLPPVDYIMELIYEAAVLINDVKLMVRCMDCLQISKRLKSCKKNITAEIAGLDEILTKNKKDPPQQTKKPINSDSSSVLRSTEYLTKSNSSLNFGISKSRSNKS